MARITYTATDDSTAWFELDKATHVAEEETRWDGNNMISRATGSQWQREDLYRTAGGAWVIRHDNRDGRFGGVVGVTWHGVTAERAEEWLRKQDLHDVADEHFEAVEERGPGRPEIGGRATMALGDDLLPRIDAAAKAAGLTRAEWVRRACEATLRR